MLLIVGDARNISGKSNYPRMYKLKGGSKCLRINRLEVELCRGWTHSLAMINEKVHVELQ